MRWLAVGVLSSVFFSGSLLAPEGRAAEPAREKWTQSKLRGSPEPPLPYMLEQAFPHEFTGPISLNRIPASSMLLVLEQNGKIFHFDSKRPESPPELLVDFNATLPPASRIVGQEPRRVQLYSIAFHPDFANNRYAFVCYTSHGPGSPIDTHISRFLMPAEEEPQLLVESELSVLVCEGGGHNGATVAFGPDGYLYFSIGDLDVPTPPDPRETGQDISDLYASILRIDVDRTSGDTNYAIPEDNPFVHLPEARPEVYAYGLRNPFRMAFDEATGDLWVGDVGWEAWEMVYRVKPGGNYGWAIKEGPGDVKPQTPGPTPILPPDIALGHAEAASVTGGMVYHGTRLPRLSGKYIFGDWITRKFWAASFDSQRVLDTQEIATGSVKPVCFETDHDGELLILEYSNGDQPGGIYRLTPNVTQPDHSDDFPRLLSQTGLFSDTPGYVPAPGVQPYSLNAPMWADGAQTEYLLAVPDDATVTFSQQPRKTFDWFTSRVLLPIGSALVRTISVDQRRVETQLSLKDELGEWQYYTYRWNAAGDDAELVNAAGETTVIDIPTAGRGSEPREWTFAARASCRICHTPWTGETVGFIEPQLRGGHVADSWHELLRSGAIEIVSDSLSDAEFSGLVNPHDAQAALDRRARSYLHTNCAHCHMNGGNASTVFGLNFDLSLAETKMIDVAPMRGDLGVSGANIVTAGRPQESVLLYRMAKAGSGHMPHIGPQRVDPQGLRLLQRWIAGLSPDAERRQWLDAVCAPITQSTSVEPRLVAAEQLLGSVPGAFELSLAMADGAVPKGLQSKIVELAMLEPPTVSELFEAYATAEQLPARLGENFAAADVLSLPGDAARGRQLFAAGVGTCMSCHRVGEVGQELGPDFGESAAKYKTAEKLLEQIVRPSLSIDEKYQAVSVLSSDGELLVGRIVEENDQAVTLLDAAGKRLTIARADIEAMKQSPVSLMPEQLLASVTARQAADLLAYMLSLQQPVGNEETEIAEPR